MQLILNINACSAAGFVNFYRIFVDLFKLYHLHIRKNIYKAQQTKAIYNILCFIYLFFAKEWLQYNNRWVWLSVALKKFWILRQFWCSRWTKTIPMKKWGNGNCVDICKPWWRSIQHSTFCRRGSNTISAYAPLCKIVLPETHSAAMFNHNKKKCDRRLPVLTLHTFLVYATLVDEHTKKQLTACWVGEQMRSDLRG